MFSLQFREFCTLSVLYTKERERKAVFDGGRLEWIEERWTELGTRRHEQLSSVYRCTVSLLPRAEQRVDRNRAGPVSRVSCVRDSMG